VIIVKEPDVNPAQMKNPVRFVRVQGKVKTTSIVDMSINLRSHPTMFDVSASKDMFLMM
jgi:hypothetical protein